MRALILDRSMGNPYSRGLAIGLAHAGVEVCLGGPTAFEDSSSLPLFPRSGMPGQRLRKIADCIQSVPRFFWVLARFRPNVVHVQWADTLDIVYAAMARLRGARVVYTAHNPGPRSEGCRQSLLLGITSAVITHGPNLRRSLLAHHPGLVDRVHVVEHGNYAHAVQRFEATEARRRLGLSQAGQVFAFVGQLQPRKGLECLVEAHARYRSAGRGGDLLLVGTAPSREYLQKLRTLARAHGGAPRFVTSLSHLPDEVLNLVASAADAIVLPFVDATQSGSVIFAMTHGRCVVTTPVGEVGRTVQGRGILVPAGSVDSLAAALRQVEENPAVARQLGERGREYALTQLDWQHIGVQTRQVYERAFAP